MIVTSYKQGNLSIPEKVLNISLNTLCSLHDYLVITFFIPGCNIFDDNQHQMAYPILQLFDLLLDGRRILTIKYCESRNFSWAESHELRIFQ